MTHISRRRLNLYTQKVLKELIRSAFTRLNTDEISPITKTLLSKTELAMLEKRVGIILLLELGHSLEEVADITKTTRQTVSRFQLQLKLIPLKDKKLLMRKLKSTFMKEVVKDFLKNLDISRTSFQRKISPF